MKFKFRLVVHTQHTRYGGFILDPTPVTITFARRLSSPADVEEEAALVVVGVGLEAKWGVVRPHPAPHDAVHVHEHQQGEHDLCGSPQ